MSTLVLTGTVTNIYLSSRPVSYERCMLDNMRGQDRSVYGLSSEICLKQSHLTITLPVRKTAVGLGADYRYLSTDRLGEAAAHFADPAIAPTPIALK